MSASTAGTKKKAPFSAYVLAAGFGLVLATGLGALAGTFRPEQFWLVGGVFALCTFAPMAALGWLLFVSRHTVEREPHAEQSVERSWLERAQSGAFLDVLIATGVGLTTLAITDLDVSGTTVLTAVVLLSMVDAAVRYQVLSRRES
ncbi:hypothetical protein [Georgenia sp. SYP-B2076]|uniref:hypothetical protein n=1 Tax=Georgenia sp. SYP-B2076 TaxID=2495881 RepID=UPI000F8E63EC|nr:hypothetical protein [Georgenia sp. SYP-B2076]